MKNIIKYLVIAIPLVLIAYFVSNSIGKSGGTIVKHVTDTVTVVKTDTVTVVKNNVITKWKAKLDTVYVDSMEVVKASADTVLTQDSSSVKVSYLFPPLNYFDVEFDLREKTIYEEITTTILDSVVVQVNKPFYEDTWFWTTILLLIGFIFQ